MGQSIARRSSDRPDNSLITARPVMAKADISGKPAGAELSGLIKAVSRKVHGKQAAAAAIVGKAESNFSRDVDAGVLRTGDLAQLGPQFLAELGRELVNSYGALNTPQTRIRPLAQWQREISEELQQLAEFVA